MVGLYFGEILCIDEQGGEKQGCEGEKKATPHRWLLPPSGEMWILERMGEEKKKTCKRKDENDGITGRQ